MTNYAGNPDNYPENVPIPEGSDFRNATTLAAALQSLADRAAYLAKRIGGASNTSGVWYPIPVGAAYFGKTAGATPAWIPGETTGYTTEPLPALFTNGGISTTTLHFFVLPLSSFLPPAGFLRAFQLDLYGTATYTGIPEHMPAARLYNLDPNTLTRTLFVPATDLVCIDGTATTDAYKLGHQLGISSLTGSGIDLSVYRGLHLRVESEYGTNAQNNTFFYNPRCKVAPTG